MAFPPKTAHSTQSFPMHVDQDSGFLVPDDPIPDFGASLVDLAFDDRTLSTVLQSSGEKPKDGYQPTPLDTSAARPGEHRPDAASQKIVDEMLAKYAKSPFKD